MKTILKLLISLGLLAIVFWKVPIQETFSFIQGANIQFILFAYFLVFCSRFIENFQLDILFKANKIRVPFWDILIINTASNFYNLFLPGFLGGGAYRVFKFSKFDTRPAEIVSSIIFNRLIGVLIIVGLGLYFWIFGNIQFENAMIFYAVLLFAVLLGGIFFIATPYPRKILKAVMKMLPHTKVTSVFDEKVSKVLRGMELFSTLSKKDYLFVVLSHLASNFVSIFIFFLMAKAIDLPIGVFDLAWVRSCILLATFVPISFSGVGIREGGLLLLLKQFEIAPSLIVAFSMLLLSRIIFLGLFGGLVEFIHAFFVQNNKKISTKPQ